MFLLFYLFQLHVLLNFVYTQRPSNHCFTPDEHAGQCIEIKDCDLLYRLRHKTPHTHRDRLFLSLSLCGYANSQPLVCCSPDSTYPKESLEGNNASELITLPRKTTNLPDFSECAAAIEDRIVGGTEAKIDEFPFSALLIYSKTLAGESELSFNCGGSLISSKFILTAAHCIHTQILKRLQLSLTGARLGEHNLKTDRDCGEGIREDYICAPLPIDVGFEQQIIHENFDQNNHNDIALLKINREVQFNQFVRPICLPMNHFDTDNLNFIVTGFGKTENGVNSEIKLKTNVSGVKNIDCQSAYKRRVIASSQLCAQGIDGMDSCSGDSGNGLVYINTLSTHAHWLLLGITSFGANPCGQEIPGVYTRVSEFIPWILNNTVLY